MNGLELLGLTVRDRVTGFTGVVTSVSYDLYGCVQGLVNPGMGKEGKLGELLWFDIGRLAIVNDVPVMVPPVFVADKGAESKPYPAAR